MLKRYRSSLEEKVVWAGQRSKAIGKDGSLLHERTLARKDGSLVYTEVHVRAVEGVGYISIFRDITERKTAEAAFRESELKFKNLVEKSLVGVYIVQDGKFVYVNPKFAQILGYTQLEMLGLDNIRDIVDTQYAPPALVEWRKKADAGIIDDFHIELKYRKKDGEIIWCDAYCGETSYEGAKAILGSIMDITERKKAEAKILERESLLTALFENIEGSLALYDVNKKIMLFNSHFAHNYRLFTNHEPKVGDGVHDFVLEENRDEPSKMMDSALKGNKVVLEKDYHNNGKFSSFRTSFNPVINDGKVTGFTSFSLDLTQSKEAELRLKESEEKFRLSFMTSNDAFYIGTLHDGRIIDANNSFYSLYGYTKEETIGKTIFDLNLYANTEDRKRLVAQLKANGHIKDFETNSRKKDGQIMLISMTINVWQINGEPVIMAVIRDITERRKTQALIQEQAETFAAIIENASESIWLLSVDLRVLLFNKTAKDRLVLNGGNEIYLGANVRDFLYKGTESVFMPMFSDALAGKYSEVESAQVNSQGATFWLRTRM
ncbi:PAS domain-containing protein [Dyadobacter pollutisoli]|uniref:histidine kinase n=1 Tax=Dyadobacter pollutisoli TaxID=2910158 RepID=A0A9E8SMC8_9BACT|nr:PAS domain S-box protein [Dyadobacter pollutisoli]WAC13184.1 PAS domain S-box protein [Dyadobacter pollutisoli]